MNFWSQVLKFDKEVQKSNHFEPILIPIWKDIAQHPDRREYFFAIWLNQYCSRAYRSQSRTPKHWIWQHPPNQLQNLRQIISKFQLQPWVCSISLIIIHLCPSLQLWSYLAKTVSLASQYCPTVTLTCLSRSTFIDLQSFCQIFGWDELHASP